MCTDNPIHIHIYPDKVSIYNNGKLPETWTVEDLFLPHTSKPYNPLIAGTFFRSGQIEAWGRGVEKITEACKSWGKPEPFYRVWANEVMIGLVVVKRNFFRQGKQQKMYCINSNIAVQY